MSKLPTAEETLLKHASRRYAGDVAYAHGDSQVVITGDVLAAIEAHTAAHTAALQDRIKELEDKYETQIGHLSAENSDLANQIEGLCNGSKKLRETVMELKAENTRYRDRIGEALKFLQSRQQTTPGLGAPVTILKQALEK